MALLNWLRSPKARPTTRQARARLGVQQLEARDVPTADFLSALGVGDDAGGVRAVDVAVDTAGNTYLTGNFSGTVDFDPASTRAGDTDILTSAGGNDAFVAMYAPDNSLVWARRMGGDLSDVGRAIALDAGGNVYVSGEFAGTADFGIATRTSTGGSDGFAAKLDSTGTVQWASQWGTWANEQSLDLDVDASGNVYAMGYLTTGTTTYNNGYDVVKFAQAGETAWAKWFNTRAGAPSGGLATDAGGNVFVVGQFTGTVDFDPSSKTRNVSSGPSQAAFTLKLTSAGAYSWVTPFVGQGSGATAGFASAHQVVVDGTGRVVVAGSYQGPVDFNPGTGQVVLPTIGRGFMAKLNQNGSLNWAKALESDNSVFFSGLAVDAAGSIYATGVLFGTVDFDPSSGTHSRTTVGGTDVFVLKWTSTGSFGWAESFGTTGSDGAGGIAVGPAGTIHFAGYYAPGSIDFDPDPVDTYELTNPGTKYKMFLVKLSQN